MASDPVLQRLRQLHPRAIDLSLDRLQRLLAALGHPERHLPPVIHVAGTNGKGSVCAYLRAMLEADGKRVHVYTSPHLVHFHERIRLAGQLIDEALLTAVLEECERVNAGRPITEFEIITAAAFLAFTRVPADWLILETGLGGSFDATNVVARPAATAITSISLDHQSFLGDTVAEIAVSKAGILKSGVIGVIGPQTPEALAVIEARAAEVGAPLRLWGRDFVASSVMAGLGPAIHDLATGSNEDVDGRAKPGHDEMKEGLLYRSERGERRLPMPALPGVHQLANAAVAIAVAESLGLDERAMANGLTGVQWPARLQRLHGPLLARLPVESELWLDGGHNPGAGEVLAASLAQWPPRPLELVVGMLVTKPPRDFLAPLAALRPRVQGCAIPDEPSGRPAADIVNAARALGLIADEAASIPAALDRIAAAGGNPRVLICGSLYFAGVALALDGAG